MSRFSQLFDSAVFNFLIREFEVLTWAHDVRVSRVLPGT